MNIIIQKTKRILALSLLLAASGLQAQKNPSLITSGTYFASGVQDKHWNNANGRDFTKASFKVYSGETFVILKAVKEVDVVLSFDIKLTAGCLALALVEGNDIVADITNLDTRLTGTTTNTGETRLKLKPGKEYRISFTGRDAKGSYYCSWAEI